MLIDVTNAIAPATHPAHQKIFLVEMSSKHLGSVAPRSFYLNADLLSLPGAVNFLLVMLDAGTHAEEDELLAGDTDGGPGPADPGLHLDPHRDGVPPGEDVLRQDPQLAGKDGYGAELLLLLSDQLGLVLSEPDKTSNHHLQLIPRLSSPRSHLSNRW